MGSDLSAEYIFGFVYKKKWLQDNICNVVHGLCFCKSAYKYWKERALVLKHLGHLYLEIANFLSGSSVIYEVYLTLLTTLLFLESETFPLRVITIASTLMVEVAIFLSCPPLGTMILQW